MNRFFYFLLLGMLINSSVGAQDCDILPQIPPDVFSIPISKDSLTATYYFQQAKEISKSSLACAIQLMDSTILYGEKADLVGPLWDYYLKHGNYARSMGNSDLATISYQKAYNRTLETKNLGGAYLAGYNLVVILSETYRTEEALTLAKELLAEKPDLESRSIDQVYILLHNMMGQGERNARHYDVAIDWFERGVAACQRDSFPYLIPYFYNNEALVYSSIADRNKELELYQQALAAMQDETHQLWGVVQCNIARIQYLKGNLTAANSRYQTVLENPHKSYLDSCVATIASGKILVEEEDYGGALPLLRSGMVMAKILNDAHQQIICKLAFGELWAKKERYDSARVYFTSAIHTIKDFGASDFVNEYAEAHYGLLNVELKSQNQQGLTSLLDSLMVAKDSIAADEILAQVQNTRVRYETAAKERENKWLKEESDRQRTEQAFQTQIMYAGFGLGAMLLMALGGFTLYYRKYNGLLEMDKAGLEADKRRMAKEKEELAMTNASLAERVQALALLTDPEAKIVVRHGANEYPLLLKDIIYLKGIKSTATYHLVDGTTRLASESFSQAYSELASANFQQIERTTAVNLAFLQKVTAKTVVMDNGEELKLSRAYKEELKNALKAGED